MIVEEPTGISRSRIVGQPRHHVFRVRFNAIQTACNDDHSQR